MALIYVETFTGSDKTGDGSELNPFQTTDYANEVGRANEGPSLGFIVITLPPAKKAPNMSNDTENNETNEPEGEWVRDVDFDGIVGEFAAAADVDEVKSMSEIGLTKDKPVTDNLSDDAFASLVEAPDLGSPQKCPAITIYDCEAELVDEEEIDPVLARKLSIQ